MPRDTALQSEISDADDEDLFLYIAVDRDAPESQMALQELWDRHGEWLQQRCMNVCKSYKQGNSYAGDLASVTFFKAIERASTYKAGETKNDSKGMNRTRAWLGQIAKNLLIDGFRNPQRAVTTTPLVNDIELDSFSTQDFVEWFFQQNDVRHSSSASEIIGSAFERLNLREQRVIIETILQRDKSPSGNYVFRGANKILSEEFGIHPDSIRQIRRRALKKIQEALDNWKEYL